MKTNSFVRMQFTAAVVTFALLSMGGALRAQSMNMQYVTVGNPGNAADQAMGSKYGSVGYTFNIGAYDVTDSQYCTFLNEIDSTRANTLGLYTLQGDPELGISLNSDAVNGAKYSVINGYAGMPVVNVSFWNVVRVANFLDNRSAETRAYTLDGNSPLPSNWETVTRKAGATVWIPSENKWYKAAYYDALSNRRGAYWTYARQSHTTSGNIMSNGLENTNLTAQTLTLQTDTTRKNGMSGATNVRALAVHPLSGAAPSITFASGSTYNTGSNSGPQMPGVADIFGNGTLDLIIPLYAFDCATPGPNDAQGNKLLVLVNNGDGTFVSGTTLTAGHGAICVAAADLTGNGNVDLICANRADNMLTVFYNNGYGAFVTGTTLPVGNKPTCVVAADVNGDGYLDLICSNFGSNTLTVWFNNGSGGFDTSATLTVGNAPYCVAAGDLTGDGYVDLVSANYNDGTLTVLKNNGTGVFGLNGTYTVGSNPLWVAAADVTGDGNLDLICSNFGSNTWTVLLNNGSGGFVPSATYSNPLGGGYVTTIFTVGDFNGDGKPDLICGTSGPGCDGGDNKLIILTNNGDGTFVISGTLSAGNKTNCVAADLNGNGKLDLVSLNYLDGTVTVLMNTTVYSPAASTPKLGINAQGKGVRLAWPSNSAGWELQQNADLTTPNWLPSGYGGYGIADNGANKSLFLPMIKRPKLFFRLLHP